MSYANAWSRWFDVIEAGAGALSGRMITLGEVERATTVLDIGTGLGEPAITAARILGQNGRVTALDSDPRMVAFAGERADREDISNIDFQVGDVESVNLPPGGFDVILARWSLMFVNDKPGLLRKLAQALRPGGRIVAGLWHEPDRVPALTLAERSLYEHFGWPLDARPTRKAFCMADENAAVDLFCEAGFRDVASETCEVAYLFDTPRSYIQYRLDVVDPLCEAMKGKPPDAWEEAYTAIERSLVPYIDAEGRCRLVNEAYSVVGRR